MGSNYSPTPFMLSIGKHVTLVGRGIKAGWNSFIFHPTLLKFDPVSSPLLFMPKPYYRNDYARQ